MFKQLGTILSFPLFAILHGVELMTWETHEAYHLACYQITRGRINKLNKARLGKI